MAARSRGLRSRGTCSSSRWRFSSASVGWSARALQACTRASSASVSARRAVTRSAPRRPRRAALKRRSRIGGRGDRRIQGNGQGGICPLARIGKRHLGRPPGDLCLVGDQDLPHTLPDLGAVEFPGFIGQLGLPGTEALLQPAEEPPEDPPAGVEGTVCGQVAGQVLGRLSKRGAGSLPVARQVTEPEGRHPDRVSGRVKNDHGFPGAGFDLAKQGGERGRQARRSLVARPRGDLACPAVREADERLAQGRDSPRSCRKVGRQGGLDRLAASEESGIRPRGCRGRCVGAANARGFARRSPGHAAPPRGSSRRRRPPGRDSDGSRTARPTSGSDSGPSPRRLGPPVRRTPG